MDSIARWLGASCACIVVSLASDAAAVGTGVPESTFRIEWPAVRGCPTKAAVHAHAIRALAGATEFDRVFARVDLVAPTETSAPWRVRIRTISVRGSGERSLEAASCDELARATALIVALAALRTDTPADTPALEELAPPYDYGEGAPFADSAPLVLPRRHAPPHARTHEPDDDGHVALALGGFLDTGVLPSVAVGGSVHLDYELGSIRVRVSLLSGLSQEKRQGAVGATFGMAGGSFELCYAPIPAIVRPHACAGIEIDRISGRGSGGEANFETTRGTALAFGGLGADWSPFPHARVGLDARFGPSLRRPTFAIESAAGATRELFEPSAARLQTVLTFGVVF